ncbi:hypothetical protein ACFU5Y_13880 [Streptomyces gardneri]|uniref:hypothetical protein n=1 Tax=Streptomyces gardneri TaxID=66892 RepID=UPI00369C184F
MAGYRVTYVLATQLDNELVEATDEKQLTKTTARYGRAELLFQVPTEREEKNSVAIAPDESPAAGPRRSPPRLGATIVGRLTFNGSIIETGTDSYRFAKARARAQEPAKAG